MAMGRSPAMISIIIGWPCIGLSDVGRAARRKWAVIDLSAGAHTLLTADRPFTTSHGLGNPSCLLGVPLSPTRLFVAANDVAQLRRLAAQKPNDTVRNANALMVKLAIQNVYGSTDGHLAFVEKRLRRAGDSLTSGNT
jgi:hypothetical protein